MSRLAIIAAIVSVFLCIGEARGEPAFPGMITMGVQPTSYQGVTRALTAGMDDQFFKSRKWRELVRKAKGKKPKEVMGLVNRFWNNTPYRGDMEAFGFEDYAATPTEFLKHGGDCEDYAIAKYLSLRKLGFDGDKLKIVMVRLLKGGEDHAVLAVDLDGKTWFLDNRDLFPISLAEARRTYQPVRSMNDKKQWAYVPIRGQSGRLKPAAR